MVFSIVRMVVRIVSMLIKIVKMGIQIIRLVVEIIKNIMMIVRIISGFLVWWFHLLIWTWTPFFWWNWISIFLLKGWIYLWIFHLDYKISFLHSKEDDKFTKTKWEQPYNTPCSNVITSLPPSPTIPK